MSRGSKVSGLPTLLLVEDDAPVRQSLRLALLDEDYAVLEAGTGEEALRQLREAPDAVLLDVLLPDVNGIDLCRQIRPTTAAPIIMISALTSDADITRGLAAGADDYIRKPFRAADLAHRLSRLLQPATPPGVDADAEADARSSQRAGGIDTAGVVPLTHIELRLLHALSAYGDHRLVRAQLLDQIWGHDSDVTSRALDARLASLRAKLDSVGTTLPALAAATGGGVEQ